MRFFLRSLLMLLLFSGSVARPAQATHILGGDIAYEPVSGTANQFRVQVRLYRDLRFPQQVTFDPAITLTCSRGGCTPTAADTFSVRLRRDEVLERRSLGCNGNGFEYEMHLFEGLVTLPPARWLLHVVQENRTGNIYNLSNSIDKSFLLEALLDNTSPASRRNSSPRFTTFTLPALCLLQTHHYSFSAFDADGDSLTYESVQPLAGQYGAPQLCGVPIPYSGGGLSAAQPITFSFDTNGQTGPFFQLNTATGELITKPTRVGMAAVAVRVDEYRRLDAANPRAWTRIGSVTRDVVYTVLGSTSNHNPSLSAVTVAGAAGQFLNQPIAVLAGQTAAVTLTATDPDVGQALRLSSDAAATVPGVSWQAEAAGSNQAVLTWQIPYGLPAGRYPLTVTLTDNACPLNGNGVYTIVFEVGARSALAVRMPQADEATAAYPQPFHEQVQFRVPAGPVLITDGLGRLVARLLAPPTGWCSWRPAPHVPAGIYFAHSEAAGPAVRLCYAAPN